MANDPMTCPTCCARFQSFKVPPEVVMEAVRKGEPLSSITPDAIECGNGHVHEVSDYYQEAKQVSWTVGPLVKTEAS